VQVVVNNGRSVSILDVLVGIDGSPESATATTAALELLGDRVGRLTLMALTEVDGSTAGREERRASARSWSARPRRSGPGCRSGTCLLRRGRRSPPSSS
jgi:fructose-1,6-bisphosphatase/sedoheptulose 1,7-bisphosphatase-like protein